MASDIETVTRVLAEHGPDFARVNHCRCGVVIHDESQFRSHVAAEVVAALNLPDLIRRAKADALEDFAHRHVLNQSPGRMAEDLLEHAAAIRAGRPT